MAGRELDASIPWLRLSPELVLGVGMRVDPLAAIMLVVVTSVSLLVHLYSRGYLGHEHHGHWELDPSYARFFAFLCLFTCAMLGLVLSNNLLAVYMFLEGVRVGFVLLIGFWYDRGLVEPQLKDPAITGRTDEGAKKAWHHPMGIRITVGFPTGVSLGNSGHREGKAPKESHSTGTRPARLADGG